MCFSLPILRSLDLLTYSAYYLLFSGSPLLPLPRFSRLLLVISCYSP